MTSCWITNHKDHQVWPTALDHCSFMYFFCTPHNGDVFLTQEPPEQTSKKHQKNTSFFSFLIREACELAMSKRIVEAVSKFHSFFRSPVAAKTQNFCGPGQTLWRSCPSSFGSGGRFFIFRRCHRCETVCRSAGQERKQASEEANSMTPKDEFWLSQFPCFDQV